MCLLCVWNEQSQAVAFNKSTVICVHEFMHVQAREQTCCVLCLSQFIHCLLCVWNVRLLMMLSLGKGTAGGRIIATLTQTHQSGRCSHMWRDPPFPPEFNVEEAHCGSASFVETVMLTPPTRTESIIATFSNSQPAAPASTLNFRGAGNKCPLALVLSPLAVVVCIVAMNVPPTVESSCFYLSSLAVLALL